MTCLDSNALTIDAEGMDFLAAVVGTKPGDRTDEQFRAAFDPGRVTAPRLCETRSPAWSRDASELTLSFS